MKKRFHIRRQASAFRVRKTFLFFCLIGLFFISTILTVIVRKSINNFLFLLLIGAASAFGMSARYKKTVVLLLLAYMMLLGSSLAISFIYGIELSCAIKQLFYYLKPALFFIVGYCFLDRKYLDVLFKAVFAYMILGTIFAISYPDCLSELTTRKLVAMGYAERNSEAHLWVFNSIFVGLLKHFWVTRGGFVLRNPTFVFSPLESGFILAFLCSYFYYMSRFSSRRRYRLLFYASLVMLITTLVRSALLFFVVTYFIYIILFIHRGRRRIVCGMLMLIGVVIFCKIFYDDVYFLFAKESSASIHLSNLGEALNHIFTYPGGTGMGSSGWHGDKKSPYFTYSEGSLFSSLIENGIQFLAVYIVMIMILYRKSRYFLFPIFIGYCTASFLLPIGFSSLFNALFFTAVGVTLRKYWRTPATADDFLLEGMAQPIG